MLTREFIDGFSTLIAKEVKGHLDEPGETVGDGLVDWVDGEAQPKKSEDNPDIPLVSSVSEDCMRSVVFGLLGI